MVCQQLISNVPLIKQVWRICPIVQYGTLSSQLSSGVSLRQTGPVVYHRPHLIIFGSRPWKEGKMHTFLIQSEALHEISWPMSISCLCVTIYPSYWVPEVIHVNFLPLAAQLRGLPLTWASHLCTVMPSPIVHWCPGQPGPRVTRNSKPGLNLWWMQSDELVSCDSQ